MNIFNAIKEFFGIEKQRTINYYSSSNPDFVKDMTPKLESEYREKIDAIEREFPGVKLNLPFWKYSFDCIDNEYQGVITYEYLKSIAGEFRQTSFSGEAYKSGTQDPNENREVKWGRYGFEYVNDVVHLLIYVYYTNDKIESIQVINFTFTGTNDELIDAIGFLNERKFDVISRLNFVNENMSLYQAVMNNNPMEFNYHDLYELSYQYDRVELTDSDEAAPSDSLQLSSGEAYSYYIVSLKDLTTGLVIASTEMYWPLEVKKNEAGEVVDLIHCQKPPSKSGFGYSGKTVGHVDVDISDDFDMDVLYQVMLDVFIEKNRHLTIPSRVVMKP